MGERPPVYDVLPIGPNGTPLFGVPIDHRRLYNVREAGIEFAMVPKTLLRYAEANGVANVTPVRTQHGPRKWITIPAAAAPRLFRVPLRLPGENGYAAWACPPAP